MYDAIHGRTLLLATAWLTVATVWGQPTPAGPRPPSGLLLAAHFDAYVGASWATGTRTFLGLGREALLVPGRFGKAMGMRTIPGIAVVGNDGNFRIDQGTLEMWIRPAWDGDDGRVHALFSARAGPKNYLNCNKLDTNRLGVATGGAGTAGYRRVDADVSEWHAEEWHHVAFSWGDGRLVLYLDGAKAGEADGAVMLRKPVKSIRIGQSLAGDLDELIIWDHPRAPSALSAPVPVADLPPVQAPVIGLPPVGSQDRYTFELPPAENGFVVTPKLFVDEVDPDVPPPMSAAGESLSVLAARDEWQSVGFVIYATRDLEAVTVTASDLGAGDDRTISAEHVSLFLNRRVLQRRAPRVPDDDRVPVAALLDPAEPFDLPGGCFKEVTVTVKVPAGAVPAEYGANISISTTGGTPVIVPLAVRVLPFRLQPSVRKAFGVYLSRFIDLSPQMRPSLRADLRDLRDHWVTHLFCHLGIDYRTDGETVVPDYSRLTEGLALLREFGFRGGIVIQTNYQRLAQLLGHEDVRGRDARGASLDGDDVFAQHAEQALRGLQRVRQQFADFELIVTHMDEVLGGKRLPLYINLTKPVRRVPEQRVYITLHTIPRPGVPELTRRLDPYVDVRCYNGHALDLWLQAGHTFDELGRQLAESGDEGWMYYNPHRPFFVARWAQLVNGLYLWRSPLRVHCPFRYRTMRSYPFSYTHNMGFTVKSPKDALTPIATRQWEGYRLGAQDTFYFCMLQDLVGQAGNSRSPAAANARKWLGTLRGLVPGTAQIQEVPTDERRNYPLLFTMAQRLGGARLQELRSTTADHIVALQKEVGDQQ